MRGEVDVGNFTVAGPVSMVTSPAELIAGELLRITLSVPGGAPSNRLRIVGPGGSCGVDPKPRDDLGDRMQFKAAETSCNTPFHVSVTL